jgi:sugar O-acyltransferase (sialic acid O-acetyltransferase NeuD family)
MVISKIVVPLLNANEPEARLVDIHVTDGQMVPSGAALFTIETTKATLDIEAETPGYIRIMASPGDILGVGALLAVITEKADDPVELEPVDRPASKGDNGSIPSSADSPRITRPARTLAESLGVDITTLPRDELITEESIRNHIKAKVKDFDLPPEEKPYILIYGAGGHAKTIIDMVMQLDTYTIAGILDDNEKLAGTQVLGVPVLGDQTLLSSLTEKGVKLAANGVGGILDINIRVNIFKRLAGAGFAFPILVHPCATIEPSAKIEAGVQVFANAYIGSEAILHSNCMVNTNAVISHDCEIGAYTHIAPGALLAGSVRVGEGTLIGMGVTTSIGVKVGSGVRVGNGAILLADVPNKTIIQAGRFWTGKAETLKVNH